jgi:hypothetical protein
MATGTAIPIVIREAAAARVAELGLQRALDQMLERAQQTVAKLRALDVVLAEDPEGVDEPRIIIEATVPEPERPAEDSAEWDFALWKVSVFPPEVFTHFLLMTAYDGRDGR